MGLSLIIQTITTDTMLNVNGGSKRHGFKKKLRVNKPEDFVNENKRVQHFERPTHEQ